MSASRYGPVPGDTAADYFAYAQSKNLYSVQVFCSETKGEFADAVTLAVDAALGQIEEGGKLYAEMAEPTLSFLVVQLLSAATVPATAEEFQRGRTDIKVRHPRWLSLKLVGECKIWKSRQYHVDGCDQLLGYCTGRDAGALCIEFFKKPGMYQRLLELQTHFDNQLPLKQFGSSVPHNVIQGAYMTAHEHSSAALIGITHLGCDLYVGR